MGVYPFISPYLCVTNAFNGSNGPEEVILYYSFHALFVILMGMTTFLFFLNVSSQTVLMVLMGCRA